MRSREQLLLPPALHMPVSQPAMAAVPCHTINKSAATYPPPCDAYVMHHLQPTDVCVVCVCMSTVQQINRQHCRAEQPALVKQANTQTNGRHPIMTPSQHTQAGRIEAAARCWTHLEPRLHASARNSAASERADLQHASMQPWPYSPPHTSTD